MTPTVWHNYDQYWAAFYRACRRGDNMIIWNIRNVMVLRCIIDVPQPPPAGDRYITPAQVEELTEWYQKGDYPN